MLASPHFLQTSIKRQPLLHHLLSQDTKLLDYCRYPLSNSGGCLTPVPAREAVIIEDTGNQTQVVEVKVQAFDRLSSTRALRICNTTKGSTYSFSLALALFVYNTRILEQASDQIGLHGSRLGTVVSFSRSGSFSLMPWRDHHHAGRLSITHATLRSQLLHTPRRILTLISSS